MRKGAFYLGEDLEHLNIKGTVRNSLGIGKTKLSDDGVCFSLGIIIEISQRRLS